MRGHQPQPSCVQDAWTLSTTVLAWSAPQPYAEADTAVDQLQRHSRQLRDAVADAYAQLSVDSTLRACTQATIAETDRRLDAPPPAATAGATTHRAQSLARLTQVLVRALVRAHDLHAESTVGHHQQPATEGNLV